MPAPATFTEAQDTLARTLKGYTRRAHQIALAEFIEQGMADGSILLAEAGTGTGKSLALMIPAVQSGKRTVVAVPTKALQDQYVGDMTFLTENLFPELRWAILKGRSNYPCWVKAQAITSPSYGQRAVIKAMEANADPREGTIIDRESFPELTRQDWAGFAMSADECPGADKCPFALQCFTERAKSRAGESEVVITNLAYLMQDLKLRKSTDGNVALLGPIEQLVIDEGHMLPEAATGALEDTMSQFTFTTVAQSIAGWLAEHEADEQLATGIEDAARQMWERIAQAYGAWSKGARDAGSMPLTPSHLISPDFFGDLFVDLYNAIDVARDAVIATRAADEREDVERSRLMRRTANLKQRIWDYTTDAPEKTVRWIEPEDKLMRGERIRRYSFRSSPVNVGPFLKSVIWDETPTVISSATLASGNSSRGVNFGPLMDRLGLGKDQARTYSAGTPFDYPEQARLFVPDKDVPDPKEDNAAWRIYAQTATEYLVTKSGGGALLLFTSRSAMQESYDMLARRFRAQGLTVLIQDGDTPPAQLVRQMKEDGNAVLFALRTFFQGVDIQGRALRLVIIDKLPFTPPTDLVFQARCEDINRRRNNQWASLDWIIIPDMILDLQQAFGRLIRHRNDYGVVAILDSRLSKKRYGTTILNALPPAKRTKDLEMAAAFLEDIRWAEREMSQA